MSPLRRDETFRWWYKKSAWIYLFIIIFLAFIRLSKGAVVSDLYAFISRPFWPGSAQRHWIQNGANLEQQIRLDLLEKDNNRLRELLSLKAVKDSNRISAAVISRRVNGFWHQLDLNKGSLDGCK